MSMSGKGLGRGLDALFQVNQITTELPPPGSPDSPFQIVSPDVLSPNPGQPRDDFSQEKLQELADSIKEKGILQPLLVRPSTQPGTYQIIAGERRWRAAMLAGIQQVPVLVRALDDNEAMIAALIENIQREDLNPIELAKGMVALKDALGISQDMLAEKLGKQRGTVSNIIRVLRLSPEGQEDLLNGRISVGHARVILGMPGGEITEAFRQHIADTGMTVREAEEAANFWRDNDRFPWEKEVREKEMDITQEPVKYKAFKTIAEQIGASLNCRTKISGTPDKGRISLAYDSPEQFNALIDKLGIDMSSMPQE